MTGICGLRAKRVFGPGVVTLAMAILLPSSDVLAQKAGEQSFKKRAIQESLSPVRLGVPGKVPFWNITSKRFIYAPAFNFKMVDGAVNYRYDILSEAGGQRYTFESKVPYAALSPIWADLPVGYFTIKVNGIGDGGTLLAVAGEGRYYRAATFNGPYNDPVMPYDRSAMTALERLMHKDFIEYWLIHQKPDPSYQYYRYPAKIYSALIIGALTYGKLKPSEAERSVKLARSIADFMISISLPEGNPYQYFPPSYYGYEAVFKRANSKINTNSIMTIISADAGNAYLDLYDVTKDEKYLLAARRIAGTYNYTQMKNGSWYLFVDRNTGKPTASNIAIPTSTINYFDRLAKDYGVKGLEADQKGP